MEPVWVEIRIGCCFIYHVPKYAVFGEIYVDDGYYYWKARVMDDCRIDHKPISGKALSLEKAKHIVEVLCLYTDTLSRNNIKGDNNGNTEYSISDQRRSYRQNNGNS